MRNKIVLSLVLGSALFAQSVTVEKVIIESEAERSVEKEVSAVEIEFTRQQDLAEILSQSLPEINLVRASAIGNDLLLRGFKRDDINVLIDGAKIYGGCPNRMDPPSMHISASQIDTVVVKEGPFDVENFGSMGGVIDVKTKDPKKGLEGELSLTAGSFDYKKISVTGNAGDDKIKILMGYSRESSDQYKDGDGKTLAQQNIEALGATADDAYKPEYKDKKAYKRDILWTKANISVADNQEAKLSVYKDKATDVLYPAFKMDAQLDETVMANGEYVIKNLSEYSDKLAVKAYYSHVRHDMGTEFRNASSNPMKYGTHRVRSTIKGTKIENSFAASGVKWKVGVDTSLRNWNGMYLREPAENPVQVRIPDVDTKNRALFAKAVKNIGNYTIKVGARYDKTDIDANNLDDPTIVSIADIQNYFAGKTSKTYNNFSANLVAKYNYSKDSSVFIGFGQGIRVPDAQELYAIMYMSGMWMRQGNPDLKETKNREVDLGFETKIADVKFRGTLFYSDLKDYIYAYKKGNTLTWANIDAHIYGGDISAFALLTDEISLEGSIAYQRGKKDTQPSATQTDEDMAQIPPLRGRVAITYDNGDWFGSIEGVAQKGYSSYDEDNGEQAVGGWGVVNLKAGKEITDSLRVNAGIDNLFDKTYAANNTYVGRALVGDTAPLLINEPGRYIYANLNYRF
ncbi:TonB-dependent receptor [Nitrosophilus alvini]|uniref:TonB-dependent receptor n=1 Tax=Nitrosophilus alvini TaxID=2714855 RepID=UPI00190BCF0C|nr:TonB-dependent receptor [Nitrosophilus alvini]